MQNIPNSRRYSPSIDDRIDAIAITSDCVTGRGGLALFSRYLSSIKINPHLDRLFGSMRRSGKGLPATALFKQLFCFLLDGTSRHLVYFDELKRDAGYAGAIETKPAAMASSHQVKRFFAHFSWQRIWLFRRLLQQLFLWRLHREQPEVIILGVDTMVRRTSSPMTIRSRTFATALSRPTNGASRASIRCMSHGADI